MPDKIERVPGVNSSEGDPPFVDPNSDKVVKEEDMDLAIDMATEGHGFRSRAAAARREVRELPRLPFSVKEDRLFDARRSDKIADQREEEIRDERKAAERVIEEGNAFPGNDPESTAGTTVIFSGPRAGIYRREDGERGLGKRVGPGPSSGLES